MMRIDGLYVPRLGDEVFRICNELVDDVVTVTPGEIGAAVRDCFEDTRSVLEPAGALSIAGLKKWVEARPINPATGQKGNYIAVCSDAANIERKPRHSPATSRRPARPRLSACNWRGQRTPTGIRLDYFKRGIGGLVDDGSFDISVTKWLGFPAIVASSRGGVENRARQESIVWQRLVLAATGDGSGGGALGLANLKAKSGVGSAILAPFCPDKAKIERIDLIMGVDPAWRRGY